MTKSTHHSFDIMLAAQYGIAGAILIHHFQHWINYNKSLGKNKKDGRTWTYQTRKEIAAWFPYFSEDQVKRETNKLVQVGVLVKGNYNRAAMDKTIWYAFKNEEIFTIDEIAHSMDDLVNPMDGSAKAIPDTKTDTKTEKKSVADAAAPRESCASSEPVSSECLDSAELPQKATIKGHKGVVSTITMDELYRRVANKRVSWTVTAINHAWETLTSYEGVIYDWWAFIEGVVKNYENKLKSKRASGRSASPKKNRTRSTLCKDTPQNKLNPCKAPSSGEDSKRQVSQNFESMDQILKRYRSGSQSPAAS